jgi:hypothetical protein
MSVGLDSTGPPLQEGREKSWISLRELELKKADELDSAVDSFFNL